MERIEESNKNLISLRASLIAVVVVLTCGMTGLFLADYIPYKSPILFVLGAYFDLLFICNILDINNKIDKNIGEIKNECK